MITYPSYTQTNSDYDYAINGVPFFSAASADAPYGRTTADWQRQQQDQSTSPGEQSLNDWWRRSQSSFHYGAGLEFFDPAQEVVAYGRARTMPLRFQDSRNINPWTKGEVSMLRNTSRPSSASSGVKVPVRGFATNDLSQQGVIYSNATGVVRKYSTSGTNVVLTPSGGTWSSTLDIIDIDVDGLYVYVMNGAGVYTCGIGDTTGATSLINSMTFTLSPSRGVLRVVKDRLVIGANSSLYNAAPGNGSALPAAFYTHPNPLWTWTGIASSGDAIFYSGYSGNQSAVFASVLETASAGSVPTVSIPFTVAELPPGEVIYSMITYLNTYIVLGTSQGVRVGLIGNNGQVQLGPLSVLTDLPVYALTARGSYVWAGGQNVNGVAGLYRLDLSTPLSSDELRFPWARDLEANQAQTGDVAGIAPLGLTDRMAFGVTGNGLWVESATDKTTNAAYLQTGRIRFDTWESKIFQYLRVQMKPSLGFFDVDVFDESDNLLSTVLTNSSTTNGFTFSLDGSDGEPHGFVSYQYKFTRSSSDSTKGPIMKGYQVLAQPSLVKQRSIRLSLLCFPKEQPTGRRRVERPTWKRITDMEAIERNGAVVRFQDFGTGENRLVRVEKVEFVAQSTGEQRWDRQNPGGILLVTLTTVD